MLRIIFIIIITVVVPCHRVCVYVCVRSFLPPRAYFSTVWMTISEWVESMGVGSGRGYQEVGVASGWYLWVWLECIGVVSGCCCKEVYRYPHNNY